MIDSIRDALAVNGAAVLGIDVSAAQKTIDWNGVKASGVLFARLTSSDALASDSTFVQNRTAARTAGISCSFSHVYHFDVDPIEQANHFAATVGSLTSGDLPPTVQIDEHNSGWASGLPTREPDIRDFLARAEQLLAIASIIYTNTAFWTNALRITSGFAEHPLWLANYSSVPSPPVPQSWRDWTFWQYSNSGTVTGVSPKVNLNRFNGTAEDLKSLLVL